MQWSLMISHAMQLPAQATTLCAYRGTKCCDSEYERACPRQMQKNRREFGAASAVSCCTADACKRQDDKCVD